MAWILAAAFLAGLVMGCRLASALWLVVLRRVDAPWLAAWLPSSPSTAAEAESTLTPPPLFFPSTPSAQTPALRPASPAGADSAPPRVARVSARHAPPPAPETIPAPSLGLPPLQTDRQTAATPSASPTARDHFESPALTSGLASDPPLAQSA